MIKKNTKDEVFVPSLELQKVSYGQTNPVSFQVSFAMKRNRNLALSTSKHIKGVLAIIQTFLFLYY
jgi:hypothetical protein